MKKRYKSRNEENLLPFHIIKAASEGDVSAINAVLKHYEGYIIKLSTRKLYDESGQVHYCIDETLRRRLETKLITKILAFEVAQHPIRKFPFYSLIGNDAALYLDN